MMQLRDPAETNLSVGARARGRATPAVIFSVTDSAIPGNCLSALFDIK
jgi:hypothetical protein